MAARKPRDEYTDDERREVLYRLQREYEDPMRVVRHVYSVMGLTLCEVHKDIVRELTEDTKDTEVLAQRGIGKTTTVLALSPFFIIHNPDIAILATSGNIPLSRRVALTIQKILSTMPELAALMPRRRDDSKDQASIDRFEIHNSLRSVNKSATLQVRPIDRAQGERFDLCFADDLETLADFTAASQVKLDERFAELQSMKTPNPGSRIIILGTPQNRRSVYIRLPALGYKQLIYPARFPTPKQVPVYKGGLAPWIVNLINKHPQLQTGGGLLGDQGRPTTPEFMGEGILQDRERKQGYARFQMRHMLNTEPLDAQRRALSTEQLILIDGARKLPLDIQPDVTGDRIDVVSLGTPMVMTRPASIQQLSYREPELIVTAIDPALGGKVSADRTGVVTVAFMQGYAAIIGLHSIAGGYDEKTMQHLSRVVARRQPHIVIVEKNAGYGMFTNIMTPFMRQAFDAAGAQQPRIEETYAAGLKNERIIASLEPVMSARSLAITRDAIIEHDESLAGLEPSLAAEHSLFQQMENISQEIGALSHDDILDALSMAVIHRGDLLSVNRTETNAEANSQRILERANRYARGFEQGANCVNTIMRSI